MGTGETTTDLLIIGAGPFGLALAAAAQEAGIGHVVVGTPMGFWRDHMPEGMLLRSTCDWSLDPLGIHSIDTYLQDRGRVCREIEPLSRGFYLEYARWFQERKGVRSEETVVRALTTDRSGLVAVTGDGRRFRSRRIVVAIGYRNFAHVPAELEAMLPLESRSHTCDLVDFAPLAGRRVLIVGGRQSAFEWAALIREAGAVSIDLSYRHDTPAFTTSDWRWVMPLIDRISDDPRWYRQLTADEKQQLNDRFWGEGRLKLEPWLAPRIDHPNVRLHPRTQLQGVDSTDSDLQVRLSDGQSLTVDHVVLATGYKVNLARVPMFDALRSALALQDGFPVLDEHFQTSVPGLYVTSLAATRDFGSFMAFTLSARAQASIVIRDVARTLRCA